MSKEITKARILQEIQNKFATRDFEPEKFLFSELVVPTYNIEQHLRVPIGIQKTISVTGTGGKLVIKAADDRKYFVHAYSVTFMAAGAYKVAGVYVTRDNDVTTFIYLDLKKNQTESYTVNLPKTLVLYPGDMLSVNIDDYTSTADIRVDMDLEREYIR